MYDVTRLYNFFLLSSMNFHLYRLRILLSKSSINLTFETDSPKGELVKQNNSDWKQIIIWWQWLVLQKHGHHIRSVIQIFFKKKEKDWYAACQSNLYSSSIQAFQIYVSYWYLFVLKRFLFLKFYRNTLRVHTYTCLKRILNNV
jgi:hypothetical protein